MTVLGAGALAAAVAFPMLLLRLWLAAAVLGGAWILLSVLGVLLILRADDDELTRRSRENEYRFGAWGQAMAKMSGGWSSGSRSGRSE